MTRGAICSLKLIVDLPTLSSMMHYILKLNHAFIPDYYMDKYLLCHEVFGMLMDVHTKGFTTYRPIHISNSEHELAPVSLRLKLIVLCGLDIMSKKPIPQQGGRGQIAFFSEIRYFLLTCLRNVFIFYRLYDVFIRVTCTCILNFKLSRMTYKHHVV